jgi:hypothetical protein
MAGAAKYRKRRANFIAPLMGGIQALLTPRPLYIQYMYV